MSHTLQSFIVLAVIIAAGVLLWRSLRNKPKSDCDGCPLIDNCSKRDKNKRRAAH